MSIQRGVITSVIQANCNDKGIVVIPAGQRIITIMAIQEVIAFIAPDIIISITAI